MRLALVVHIVAGSLSLVFGYLALYARKGDELHRRAGMGFVYAMLTMATVGTLIAAVRGVAPALNVPAGWTAAYLVTTALVTVRRPDGWSRQADIALMVAAFVVASIALAFGFQAVANGGTRNGLPAFPFFLFGVVGLFAGAGDLRMIRNGALKGASRIARHLWRMSFALFIAALSFFIGQAKVIPKPIRIMPLLALPVVAVLVTMLYWLWRVRLRRSLRGLVGLSAPEPA